jgi:hypothetical protein
MPSSGIWHRVGLARTDVSEECVASILRAEKIRKPEKCWTFANMSVLTRSARRHIPEDGNLEVSYYGYFESRADYSMR